MTERNEPQRQPDDDEGQAVDQGQQEPRVGTYVVEDDEAVDGEGTGPDDEPAK